MPKRSRSSGQPSRTVTLSGTIAEYRAIVFAGHKVDQVGQLPDEAVHALQRLERVCRRVENSEAGQLKAALRAMDVEVPDDVREVSKLDRASIEALHDAVLPVVGKLAKGMPELRAAMAKLGARLESKRGPNADPAEWQRRAEQVKKMRAHLAATGKRSKPTDKDVEQVLGLEIGSLRQWRRRYPDLFRLTSAD